VNTYRDDIISAILAQRTRSPRTRSDPLLASAVIEDWLSAQEPEDPAVIDEDADDLGRISALARRSASVPELAEAARGARQNGWSWEPIAVLLGQAAAEVRAQCEATAPTQNKDRPWHPARRARWRRRRGPRPHKPQ
jgi:hypothetical protein